MDVTATTPRERDDAGELPVLTVSELNAQARALLERGLPSLWLEGEISNFVQPRSGHCYFSLKDTQAQIRCALFRTQARQLDFRPQDGAHVRARGRVSLYTPRGDYQFIIEQMQPAGAGALQQAFEALKRRLQAEGLFEAARKRPLPAYPQRIGVITSPTGAAIRDILHVLARRFPAARVCLYGIPVQGQQAPAAIVQALQTAGERADCDVLILARGGGSLEDLWAFNDEQVARALRACPLPVVSGIGHEIDFTIADFAADHRAPTPSAAAEVVVPAAAELLARLRAHESHLLRCQRHRLHSASERLSALRRRLALCHPERRLQQQAQGIDELQRRLERAAQARLTQADHRLQRLTGRLQAATPVHRLQQARARTQTAGARLAAAAQARVQHAGQRLALASRGLHAVSPLATLERGYAIARTPEGAVLTDAEQARPGQALSLDLRRGRVHATVTGTEPAHKETVT